MMRRVVGGGFDFRWERYGRERILWVVSMFSRALRWLRL